MPDGEVTRDRLRADVVRPERLAARAVRRARLAPSRVLAALLSGDRGAPMTITCTCGTAIDESTRQPVGPVSARGAACSHGAERKGHVGPTESKRHRAVETK